MDQPSWIDSLRFAVSPASPPSPPPSRTRRPRHTPSGARGPTTSRRSCSPAIRTPQPTPTPSRCTRTSGHAAAARRPRAYHGMWAYSLFGRPPGVQLPPDDADATPDPLHAPPPRRVPSDGSTARLFSADAPPVELSADHIDAEAAKIAVLVAKISELHPLSNRLKNRVIAVQVDFIRQMLHVHSHSMLVLLFTETGIMPLRIRRFILVLGFLQYLLSQASLTSSIELDARGKKS
ncbi:hypothetical protein C8J57DRAFT_1710576 [Mycena rebaudengoi]|nr:hypothetical protein C8J57DRAFT_1710576 [Mycena rebaudengoi]